MGTSLEDEENNNPLKEIHNSILRIHKKIDYIFSIFILSSLFENFINRLKNEEKNMEDKQFKIPTLEDVKKENQYEHSVLFESFTEIKLPVLDTKGNIRGIEEKSIDKDLYSREPVQVIESADLKKVQNDYKRLEDKFDDMTTMFRMMMSEMRELKSTVNAQTQEIKALRDENQILRKENQELRNELQEVRNELKEANTEISRLNNVVSTQTQEISRLNGVVSEQGTEISRLNTRLDASEAKNQLLITENQSLKNAQKPSLRLSSMPNKRPRPDEVNESDDDRSVNDSDLETVPLSPRDAMGRKWNPITGMRDTFSIFTVNTYLTQEKQENELRRASFGNNMPRVKKLLNDNPTIVNGRGMPDSICSLAKSFNDKTPLMLAAQEGNLECVKTLIESGAALDLLDRDNFTALDYAQQNQHREVSVFLMRQKAHNGVDVIEKEDISDKMKLN